MPLAIGSHLGRYRIAALLGAGGMGEVYRATDERLGRDVALKVLRAEAIADPDRQRRFALEARAASGLNHPNILTVYDVGMDDNIPYIVAELVSGESLKDVIKRGPVPVRKALDLAIQVAGGLSAAHQAGIVHRDLKPANLMVTGGGLVKILDFGLAKSVRAQGNGGGVQAGDTAPGFIVGTANYMSPEQVRGETLDHRTDQFAFGLVLYELIAGKPAFSRSSAVSTMAAIVEEQAQPLAEAVPSIPVPLRWCVERCLEKDREGRYVSTADLQRELQTIRTHLEESSSSGPLAAPELKRPHRRRHLWPVLVGMAGIAAGLLIAGELLLPPSAADLAACHLRPVAVQGEFARTPVFSADGKSLAYTAAVGGVRQVFVRDLSSPMPAQITNAATDCERPFWSPDETRVFFFTSGATGWDLYSTGSTGGSPEMVAPNASSAALSPDGKTLAFLRADSTGKDRLSLWIADLGGAPARRFTGRPFDSAKYRMGYLAFAPGGKKLGVWLTRWDGISEFWVMGWPEGTAREPFSTVERAYPFSWMPDGRNLVFGGTVPGSTGDDLQMVDSRNGRIRPLSILTKDAVEASVSPDGGRIAFVASEDDFDLLSVPLDGSAVRTLYGTDRDEFDPTWSHSGDQLAYSTNRTGNSQIWLRSTREGWERPLVTEKDFGQAWVAAFTEPNFSPDGRRIAYSVAGSQGRSVFISAVAGGKPVRLSSESGDESSPSWNGEGSSIAYLRNTGGSWALVKAASGGNTHPVVLREGCLPSHPKWNRANSHWIACVTADGLTLISEDGKESRPLSRDRWAVYGWSRDGKTLYGVTETATRRRAITSLNIETGAQKALGDLQLPLAAEVRGFSLSPDGTSFATSASHPSGALWILEGFRKPGLLSWLP